MIGKLHYISQRPEAGTHLDAIRKVLEAGGKWIQLRIKDMPENEVLDFARKASALCKDFGAKFIVNDYPEIAVRAGADGVHLGLQDMGIAEARAIAGPELIIGGTANTFDQIVQRVAEGAGYIGLGPYRFTTTKQNLSPVLGITGYQTIMDQMADAGLSIPVIAIGGIEYEDIELLMKTGVHGVAVSGALSNRTDLALQIGLMQEKLAGANTINK